MMKSALFLTAMLLAQTLASGNAQAEATPCACPQWQWCTWSDSQGNIYYSYYSKLCDGVNEPYWVSLDTAIDFGAFPGGDCDNTSGCSAPAIPQLRGNTAVKETTKASAEKSKHAIEKSDEKHIGLGERGIGRGTMSQGPMPRDIIPRLAVDGGVSVDTKTPVFLKVRVVDRSGQEKSIYVRVFNVTLTPQNNTSPLFNKADKPPITFGTGFEVIADNESFDAEIKWEDVETVNPKKDGVGDFTSCLRFTYKNESYQVITSEKVKMK